MSIESLNAFSMDFFSLKGKTAIVTGGNSGLGQAFAMALAKAGANLFIPSFVKDSGETKEIIEKQGVEVEFMQAAFELSYEAAKIMIPQNSGKIINICSLFSWLGGQWSPAYAATKHALAGFTKAYCDELGQYNIQVNGIAPGYYATDITLATRSNPETNQRVLDHIPANRWGDTQDLMGAAIFLASQASNYVNGHLLVVDGGYLVR